MSIHQSYYIDHMANGLTFVRSRRSGLKCCLVTATGQYHHGDLQLSYQIRMEIVRS